MEYTLRIEINGNTITFTFIFIPQELEYGFTHIIPLDYEIELSMTSIALEYLPIDLEIVKSLYHLDTNRE